MIRFKISLYNAFIAVAIIVGIFISAMELDNYVSASRWGYLIAIITGIVLALNVFLNAKKTSFFYPLFARKLTYISLGIRFLRFYEHLIKPLIIFILTIFVLIISDSPILLVVLLVEGILFYALFEAVKEHDFETGEERSFLYTINTFCIHFLGVTILTNFGVSENLSIAVTILGYISTSLYSALNITKFRFNQIYDKFIKSPIVYIVLIGVYLLSFTGFLILLDPNILLISLNSAVHFILIYAISVEIGSNSLNMSKLINYGMIYSAFLLLVLVV